jgi:DNA-binding HxlR family transcriptional regulator
MFRDENNLKDHSNNPGLVLKDSPLSISYTKTDKLITALYMVTDIIDKDEPLRNKLRTLGTGIISDINTAPANACLKISEIMSFLGIASTINIISEMNCGILRKEFSELDKAIKDSTNVVGTVNRRIDLSEFFKDEPATPAVSKGHYQSIGHRTYTRIGVQKGSTLMKALSDTRLAQATNTNFDVLKKQRREDIKDVIQKRGGNVTISDIKNSAKGTLVSCGEKTLQRELISMVKDGVLYKTGEKRWSRYFLKS